MRPLTESENRLFFEKLNKFMGVNARYLIERDDEPHVFRLIKDRVYYMSEKVMLAATPIARKNTLSVGTCFGKFTKSKKFRLQITCVDYIAQFALYKVWLRPAAEMSFLYGHHVLKSGVGRMTENTPQYQGVVVLNMQDMPIGLATTARGTAELRTLEPNAVAAFNVCDVGEYLRDEALVG